MAFKAVLFDCDGVLISSEKIGSTLELEMLTALGCEVDRAELRAACFGKTQQEVFQYFRERWGSKIPASFEADFDTALEQGFQEDLKALPGVENVIAFLNLPKAVVTNSTSDKLNFMLSKTSLLDYFYGKMFSVDMVSRGKPAPDLYLMAAGQLGVAPQDCLVIEDSPVGVQAGKAAGMTVIGFIGGDHTFPGHEDLLRQAGADEIITEFTQIPDFIAAQAA